MTIPLGSVVKDNITSFQGVLIAWTLHLHKCEWGSVEPKTLKDGQPQTPRYFDAQRLEVVELAPDRTSAVPKVKPGNKVRDVITGFTGVVTTWTEELYGEPTVGVTSTELHEGKPIRDYAFAESRIELIEDVEAPVSEHSTAESGSIAEGPPRIVLPIRS